MTVGLPFSSAAYSAGDSASILCSKDMGLTGLVLWKAKRPTESAADARASAALRILGGGSGLEHVSHALSPSPSSSISRRWTLSSSPERA